MSYWNNRRICSDCGLPPAEKTLKTLSLIQTEKAFSGTKVLKKA